MGLGSREEDKEEIHLGLEINEIGKETPTHSKINMKRGRTSFLKLKQSNVWGILNLLEIAMINLTSFPFFICILVSNILLYSLHKLHAH